MLKKHPTFVLLKFFALLQSKFERVYIIVKWDYV
ncbi:hypothetical protein SAMN05216283_10178 [Sunxiuqinia elliptica]|uniref:Uncharacterized protein n=1 Tax=Sunxiuqinia elliptica TaxID=655355 RepID=A0A1I2ABW0_9BACT|nr:hypothetical protein SAMN05216283_10178 [Sunxiuqinia elliptica]